MNFALILFLLTVFTGVLWVLDKLVFAKQRRARAARPSSPQRVSKPWCTVRQRSTWSPSM